jgi:N-ethylmaleimide reductase
LPHQFLSTNVNRRTEHYGGSIEKRLRMPLELVEAVTARNPNEWVGRLSPGNTFNGIEEADLSDLYTRYFHALEASRLAHLHVIRGSANDKNGAALTPPIRAPSICRADYSALAA